jgi:hypothetical protein
LTIAGLGPLLQSGLVGEERVVRFLLWAIAAAFKPRALLITGNLCVRQQLLVLERSRPQSRLTNADRQFWIWINRWFGG